MSKTTLNPLSTPFKPPLKVYKLADKNPTSLIQPVIIQMNIGSDFTMKKFSLFEKKELYEKRYNNFLEFVKPYMYVYAESTQKDVIVCIQEATDEFITIAKKFLKGSMYTLHTQAIYTKCTSSDTYVGLSYICFICKTNILIKGISENINHDIRTTYKKNYSNCKSDACKKSYVCSTRNNCELCDPRCFIGVFSVNGTELLIANVHLPGDSKNNDDHLKRLQIVNHLCDKLKTYDNYMIVGDFNDENINSFKCKDSKYYNHKNNIKTSFHQLIVNDNATQPMIKKHEDQRELIDHIIFSNNISISSVQYNPPNGIEIGKQYPYNGLDGAKFFPNNLIKHKNINEPYTFENKEEKKLSFQIAEKFEKTQIDIISFSDHAALIINYMINNPTNKLSHTKLIKYDTKQAQNNGRIYEHDL